jgi:hypothetical protein
VLEVVGQVGPLPDRLISTAKLLMQLLLIVIDLGY